MTDTGMRAVREEGKTGRKMSEWYAVQVTTGREEETACMCRRVISPRTLQECFIPKGERMRRYEGAWHIEKKILFPGYLFFITDAVEQLYFELKHIPELTRILGDGTSFIPLEQDEVSLLLKIGGEEHTASMSSGYIEGDKIIITEGPLKNLEGTIKKIDRHKRTAAVQIKMMGQLKNVTMGVEIVRKI